MGRRFGTRRGSSTSNKASGSNPPTQLLNPANGPFTNLTAPLLSSLSNVNITSATYLSGNTQANPLKALTLTISGSGTLIPQRGNVWIWCDTLNLSSTFPAAINVNATEFCGCGGAGAGCQFFSQGGRGGCGSAGGGGGGATCSPAISRGGQGGVRCGTIFCGHIGCSTCTGHASPGIGGTGYGGTYLSTIPAGLVLPNGGCGGSGCPCCCFGGLSAPGAAGGGGGGIGNIGGRYGAGGGGGGGGGLMVIVCRVLNGSGNVTANGANGGAGCCGTCGGGGGGGVMAFYAQKNTSTLGFSLLPGNGKVTKPGNYWMTEINHAGTGLGMRHVNTNPTWNNT